MGHHINIPQNSRPLLIGGGAHPRRFGRRGSCCENVDISFATSYSSTSSAFTIVELLVVVVVIAILAAITIVAYNGVAAQARTSAVTEAVQSAAKSLALYQVNNSAFPGGLVQAGMQDSTNSGGISYQYFVSNDRTSYCVMASIGGTTASITSPSSTPTTGPCVGQPATGAVTNLVDNTSFESGTANWGGYYEDGAVRSSDWATSGAYSIKYVRGNTVANLGGVPSGIAYRTNSYTGSTSSNATQAWAQYYTVTFDIMTTTDQTIQVSGRGVLDNYDGSIYGWWEGSVTNYSLQANKTTHITQTLNLPDGKRPSFIDSTYGGGMGFKICFPAGTVDGATMYVDKVAMYLGTRNGIYHDGSTAGWSWAGTAGQSLSSGIW